MSANVLNSTFGLHCVAGNQALYRKLLGKFIDQQGEAPSAIEEALAAGDTELAHRLAHTLKGVSASLGITGVQQCATELDSAFKDGLHGADFLPPLRAAMADALRAIAAFQETA